MLEPHDEPVAPPVPLPDWLELRFDGGLVYRGHRVSVHLVLDSLEHGDSNAEIHDEFPTIPLAWIEATRDFRARQPEFCTTHLAKVHALAARIPCIGPTLAELKSRMSQRTADG